jgi:glycosyltransferase involved in cell wall biosynthesis
MENKFFKIGILIPLYNESENIEKIVSLFNSAKNNFENLDFELVLHDDNSTDDSLEKIKKFKNKDKLSIKIIENKEQNLGHGKSLIRLSTFANNYDYVFTFDADIKIEQKKFNDLFCNLDNAIYIGKRKRFKDGYFRAIITFILEIIVFLQTKKMWRDVNCPIRIYPFEYFDMIWNNVPKDSIIPNVHATKYVIEKNLKYKRIDIAEYITKKNSGVTWGKHTFIIKYKKILQFCLKAFKEL